jgi:hypothetical protein
MERFREHRKSRKCKNGAGDQPSLAFFFGKAVKNVANNPEPSPVPCPGLGHAQDSRITRYLTRTVMPTGGAPNWTRLKRHILFVNSQRSRHRRISASELESQIRSAQRAQAAWLNDHHAGVVYSAKCNSRGVLGDGGSVIIPCDECRQILRLKIFQNALRRPTPNKHNWKFTPKQYRNELLGKAYMRHIDVQEFMEEVGN